jgi:hypothetical protein
VAGGDPEHIRREEVWAAYADMLMWEMQTQAA